MKKIISLILVFVILFTVIVSSTIFVNAISVSEIKNQLDYIRNNEHPAGSAGMDCYAFVKKLTKRLFGHELPTQASNKYQFTNSYTTNFKQIGSTLIYNNGTLTEVTLKNLFVQSQAGDVVQMNYTNWKGESSFHTMMVYSASQSGVVFYHAGSSKIYFGVNTTGSDKLNGLSGLEMKWSEFIKFLSSNGDGISVYRSKKVSDSSPTPSIPSGPIDVHIHYFNSYLTYSSEHPHYKIYKCTSCDETEQNTSETVYVDTCKTCNPEIKYKDIISGKYFIKNKGNSGYLNISYGYDKDEAKIHTHTFGNYDAQVFNIYEVNDGYELMPLSSKTRVVTSYNGIIGSGDTVNLYTKSNQECQSWKFQSVGDGYIIRNVQNPHLCLEPYEYSMRVSAYTGSDNQIWYLENALPHTLNSGAIYNNFDSVVIKDSEINISEIKEDSVEIKNIVDNRAEFYADPGLIKKVNSVINMSEQIVKGYAKNGDMIYNITLSKEATEYNFADIKEDAWYIPYVETATSLGIIRGTEVNGKTLLNPENKATRIEGVIFALRMLGVDSTQFSDVSLNFADYNAEGEWSANYVKAAVALGLMKGSENNGKLYLNGNNSISRQEFFAIFARAMQITDKDEAYKETDLSKFYDEDGIEPWFVDNIKYLVYNKIVEGNPSIGGGYYINPEGQILRCEIIKMVTAALS